MRIFEGIPRGGRQMAVWLLTTTIFSDYFRRLLGNLECQRYYMAISNLLPAFNWLQNEWPWVAISCQTRFSCQHFWTKRVWLSKI